MTRPWAAHNAAVSTAPAVEVRSRVPALRHRRWSAVIGDVKFGGRHYPKRVGILVGIGLLLVIGAAIYPLRDHDYEL